jgi:hypothetical protein
MYRIKEKVFNFCMQVKALWKKKATRLKSCKESNIMGKLTEPDTAMEIPACTLSHQPMDK